VINLSIVLKKTQNNCLKDQNQPETKKSTQTHICFFMNFNGKKKTPNMNFPHQIEPFDTKIVHLIAYIGVDNMFFSLLLESGDLSLSSLN